MKIELFHSFFSEVADHIPFLNESTGIRSVDQSPVTPETIYVLNQINKLKFRIIYSSSTLGEPTSLWRFFNQVLSRLSLPFLMDDEYLSKVKRVKDIVMKKW